DGTILVWDLTPPPVPPALTDRELAALWVDLGGEAGPAFKAIRTLAGVPGQAVPFLAKQVQAVPRADGPVMSGLLARLDDRRFRVREVATAELTRMGRDAAPALREALETGKLTLEARRRVERVLTQLGPRPALGMELREVRAVEILEQIGLPTARR